MLSIKTKLRLLTLGLLLLGVLLLLGGFSMVLFTIKENSVSYASDHFSVKRD